MKMIKIRGYIVNSFAVDLLVFEGDQKIRIECRSDFRRAGEEAHYEAPQTRFHTFVNVTLGLVMHIVHTTYVCIV